MENSVDGSPQQVQERVKVRRRVPRKRSRWEKITDKLKMPHLKRAERNQRIAIGGVLVGFVIYLVILRPIISSVFPDTGVKSSKPSLGTGGPAGKGGPTAYKKGR